MNNTQLISEIEKKDLVISSLQKQLNDNLIYFKKDALYLQIEKLKNDIFQINNEYTLIYNKFKRIEKENIELNKNLTKLKNEIFTEKLSYETEIEKYKDINNKNKNEIIKLKNELEKIKFQPLLNNNNEKNIILNSNNIIEDLIKWIDGNFLNIQIDFNNYIIKSPEINFNKLINSLFNFQERIKQILDININYKSNEQNKLISDNIDLIKDNLKLKKTLNLKDITIKHLIQELTIKKKNLN
jgi:hypothetical protein